MKQVIALYGSSSKGKSTTLKKLAQLIKEQYGADAQVKELPKHNLGADFQLLITIRGTFLIGLESQGDPGGRLHRSLDLFVKANCDLIFCATRTRGSTCDHVTALEPQGYAVEWVKQTVESSGDKLKEDASNDRQAATLLKKLQALVPELKLASS